MRLQRSALLRIAQLPHVTIDDRMRGPVPMRRCQCHISSRGSKHACFEPTDRMLAREEIITNLRLLNDRAVGTPDLHGAELGAA